MNVASSKADVSPEEAQSDEVAGCWGTATGLAAKAVLWLQAIGQEVDAEDTFRPVETFSQLPMHLLDGVLDLRGFDLRDVNHALPITCTQFDARGATDKTIGRCERSIAHIARMFKVLCGSPYEGYWVQVYVTDSDGEQQAVVSLEKDYYTLSFVGRGDRLILRSVEYHYFEPH